MNETRTFAFIYQLRESFAPHRIFVSARTAHEVTTWMHEHLGSAVILKAEEV